ncbi:MAG TPA: glycosyltransferase family 39 protein [Terracidiphilus sp.]
MIERPFRRAEGLVVLASCVALSIAAVVWSWQHDAMLNYGDAVAHMAIARRVIDAHYPGLKQLGSVWLPLPHLLMLPFVAVYRWWADGIAGMIPSALAYVASCVGIYRLARRWLEPYAATAGLVFFALNPNLLYLQTTAMTEPLFLCELIWAVVWLVEWRSSLESNPHRAVRLLWLIALVLVAAVYTRYDGWILAFLAWTSIGIVLLRRRKLNSPAFWLASLLVVAAPLVWFGYNAAVFGDWLDFARGPYSAKAIEIHTTRGSGPPHPGWHDPWVSLLFFMRTAEIDTSAELWGNRMLILSVLGTAFGCVIARRRAFWWTLLLWLPVPFYAYSVAYNSVPIFIPKWWPHSWYNTRYGMEMLPAFALSLACVAEIVLGITREFKRDWVRPVAGLIIALAVWNAWKVTAEKPLTYIEGTKNIEARRPFEVQIPPLLRSLLASRPGAPVLMKTSVYPNLVAFTGIPFRQTINEGDADFYAAALAAPAAHAEIVVAFDGDEVDRAVRAHPAGLKAVGHFEAPGQPDGTVYVSDTRPMNKALPR